MAQPHRTFGLPLLLTAAVAVVAACGPSPDETRDTGSDTNPAGVASRPSDLRVALSPHAGDSELDARIRGLQQQVGNASADTIAPLLDRLGRAFIAKARIVSDPGYYKLAESCAEAIEEADPGSADALLLRGHCRHSVHAFREAEQIARTLVELRGDFRDHGLLGDVLVDRGDLDGAIEAYQAMLDERPCLQSYARASHVRWITGDVDGARKLIELACSAGSPRDPESLAWSMCRRATLELSTGRVEAARLACDAALRILPDYAPGLLARGRVELAEDRSSDAIRSLRRAVEINPLPEYRWALADALHTADRSIEAAQVERALERDGANDDPRTLALYLATRGERLDVALDLVERELEERRDLYTLDALAWTQRARGDIDAASATIAEALEPGTCDPRLYYHAGVIALDAGDPTRARTHFDEARRLSAALLPSELDDLERQAARL